MKPTTETKNTHLMPKRPASQPVSGVMIAAATMYEVTTQAIWSCEAERLPCMCGSATLAIVVSTPCMNVASMIETVIATRLTGSSGRAPVRLSPHRCGSRASAVPNRRPVMRSSHTSHGRR